MAFLARVTRGLVIVTATFVVAIALQGGLIKVAGLTISMRSLYTPMLVLTVLVLAHVLVVRTPVIEWRYQFSIAHLGMVLVGTPYGQNPQILTVEGTGGSPYGPGTLAGPDGSRQPSENELTTARNLGSRVARVAARLKELRNK
jgi:hypothetical protein